MAERKVWGGTIGFDMLVNYDGTTDRRPNADDIAAAIELALGDVDFTQGRRLQSGESVAQPIKFVEAVKLDDAAQVSSETFRITVGGFGPLLQRISTVIRTFDFLKSVSDKLRGLGKTSVLRASTVYSPVQVEGQGWGTGSDGKPIPVTDGTFPYRPVFEYDQFNATASPPSQPRTDLGGPVGIAEERESNQSVADDAVPGGLVFLIILLLLCCLSPLFCYLYAHFKYGAGKEATWFKYIFSHSNPTLPFLYVPREDREALRVALYEEKKPAATLEESTTEDEATSQSRA